jgi:acyl carrier protein
MKEEVMTKSPTEKLISELVKKAISYKDDLGDFSGQNAKELHFIEDLQFDSLDIINLLFEIETNYDVEITIDDFNSKNLAVVGNLAEHISNS